MTRRIFTLANARLVDVAVDTIREAFAKRPGSRVEVKGPKRSNDQNAAMWAMLGDIAEQVDWPVAGRMQKLDTEQWKLVFLDYLRRLHREQLVIAQSIDRTGFVDISGKHSSDLSREEMGDLLTAISAFGDENGVIWSAPKTPKGDDRPVPPVEAYEEALR